MRTVLIVFSLLCIASNIFAAAYPMEVWTATTNKSCFLASAPSDTAALAISSRAARLAWTISNPHSTYSIYITTYAAPAADATGRIGHAIGPLKDYYEEDNAYTGDVYIICPSGTTIVSGEERWR